MPLTPSHAVLERLRAPASRGSSITATACLALAIVGCGRQEAPPATQPAAAATTETPTNAEAPEAPGPTAAVAAAAGEAKTGEAKTGAEEAAAVAPADTGAAGAAPAAALEEVAPAPATDSIAIHIGTPGSESFSLPEPNKVSRIRVTPVDGAGAPIQDLEPIAGSSVVLAALRADGAWATMVSTSTKVGQAHAFELRFPMPGPHSLLFASRRPGRALHIDQAAVRVKGDWQARDAVAVSTNWKSGSWSATLTAPPSISVCEQTALLVRWSHRGKEVSPSSAPTLLLAIPLETRDHALLGQDAGSAPQSNTSKSVVFDGPSTWIVLAQTTVGKEQVTANFAVQVSGTVPAAGCGAP